MSVTAPPYPRFDGTQNCAGTDPEDWHTDNIHHLSHDIRNLKRICSTCPFLTECAEYALHTTVAGVWGGMSASDRRKIRKQRNIIPTNLEAIRIA